MDMKGSMKQQMMPAPTAGVQPLTSSEANLWLREIATVLSWLAKANVEISLRRLAGYHVTPDDKSALEYSRDAAAPVLHQIEAILLQSDLRCSTLMCHDLRDGQELRL